MATFDFTSIGSIVIAVGAIFGTLGYATASFLKGRKDGEESGEQVAAQSNEILRNLIDDQKLEITKLRASQEVMQGKMANMQAQITELTARRSFLEGLISESVNNYLESHPEMAVELAKTMVNTGVNKLTVTKK